jgi:hypothetical protein
MLRNCIGGHDVHELLSEVRQVLQEESHYSHIWLQSPNFSLLELDCRFGKKPSGHLLRHAVPTLKGERNIPKMQREQEVPFATKQLGSEWLPTFEVK